MPRGRKTTAAKKAEILELLKLGTLTTAAIAERCEVCKRIVEAVEFCNRGLLHNLRPKSPETLRHERKRIVRMRKAG